MARGVIQFLEFTLGFEPEAMKTAADTLSQAETLSYKERAKHQKYKIQTSSIYPPGTEYAVTAAEANLMHALIMLLSESVIEGAKALYKLRKAYHILDDINKQLIAQENSQMARSAVTGMNGVEAQSMFELSRSGSVKSSASKVTLDNNLKWNRMSMFGTSQYPSQLSSDDEIKTFAQKVSDMRQARMFGSHLEADPVSRKTVSVNNLTDLPKYPMDQSTIDEFISSGVSLCFGILQVVLSLLPSGLKNVLAIVGFKGNREDGVKMLWDAATKSRNIHGGIALLGLLVFYDGPFQFTDTNFDISVTEAYKKMYLNSENEHQNERQNEHQNEHQNEDDSENDSENDSESIYEEAKSTKSSDTALSTPPASKHNEPLPTLMHPGKKLEDALQNMCDLFPNNALWINQKGRILSGKGKIYEAIELMQNITRPVQMTQIEAMLVFDVNMLLVFTHQYEKAAKGFQNLITINGWSHALYTYFSGICYLELYRTAKLEGKSEKEIKKWKRLASKYIKNSPGMIGKRKFIAKNMPFDCFLARKCRSWSDIVHKNSKVDLVDAVGTSPMHELMYFWNGYGRLDEEQAKITLRQLNYSAQPEDEILLDSNISYKDDKLTHLKPVIAETEREAMIRYLLTSITLRTLDQNKRAADILDTRILSKLVTYEPGVTRTGQQKYHFNKTGYTSDPWVYPTAFYERAVVNWRMYGMEKVEETKEFLRKSQLWADDYELSTRISMKTKAALDYLELESSNSHN